MIRGKERERLIGVGILVMLPKNWMVEWIMVRRPPLLGVHGT